MQKLDIVYTWVDGQDKHWSAKKNKYAKLSGKLSKNASSKTRFLDNDELLYSLRSVEDYMPWVNHIYIVTDKQTPHWLKISDKLTIVDHTDIIPNELLPTYNSNVIEWFIGEIKGLSENFVYFCDDFLVSNKVLPSDYFDDSNQPIYRIYDIYNREPSDGPFVARKINDIINNRQIENSTYGLPHYDNSFEVAEQAVEKNLKRFFLKHAPIPIIKSQLNDLRNQYLDNITKMSESKFRSTHDISSQYLMASLNFARDKGVFSADHEMTFEYVTNKGYVQSNVELLTMFKDTHKFLSIATGDSIDEDRMAAARAVLKIKYPRPSCYETNSSNYDDEILSNLLREYVNRSEDNLVKPENNVDREVVMRTRIKNTFKKAIGKLQINAKTDTLSDEDIVRGSGYFDANYYLREYPDVAESGHDPLWHYMNHGAFEGRNPSELFISDLYVSHNPGLRDLGVNNLLHYIQSGSKATYSKQRLAEYIQDLSLDLARSNEVSKRLVVFESMQWFGGLQQRPHHLARLLADKGTTVIYVDPSLSAPVKVSDNLFVLGNDWKSLAKKMTSIKYYWLFSTANSTPEYIQELKREGFEIVYDYIDDIDEAIAEHVGVQRAVFNGLPDINPTLAIASATNLQKQLIEKLNRSEVLLAQNAVDMNHFNTDLSYSADSAPDDLRPILELKKPIIGFYGAIAPWLDYELINSVSKERNDLEFVFIGVDYNGGLDSLELGPNVHFLGPKEYQKLPEYSYWFDVATIPFKLGDIAKSTSPVKLFEYMAMGLPTVCTNDLNECRGYDYVYMSKDKDQYISNLLKAVKAKSETDASKSLKVSAERNTWQARVDDIIHLMFDIEKRGV